MADLNNIPDGHRRNVLCYCIEKDIHMIRKHSFVYLNMHMLLPYQLNKILVVIPNVHYLMWATPRVLIDI